MSDSDSELAKLEALAAQVSDSEEESSSSSSSEEEKPGEDEADTGEGSLYFFVLSTLSK